MMLKNLSRWPNKKYLNIWVVKDIASPMGTKMLGYAYYPAPDWDLFPFVDGIVVAHDAFGTTNQFSNGHISQTPTHELGHWLNLYHTFEGCDTVCDANSGKPANTPGDNCSNTGDLCCDTPPQLMHWDQTPGINTCPDGPPDLPDPIESYMSYSGEGVWNWFTSDQWARMLASLNVLRPELVAQNGCADCQECIEPPADMTAWWAFDEVFGTIVDDIAGYVNDQGILVNGARLMANGKVNSALELDGLDDYVEVQDSPALNFGTGDLSMDAWIKLDPNNTGIRRILNKRASDSSMQGYSLFISNGELNLQLADNLSSISFNTGIHITDGLWHFLAVTVDRDNTSGLIFYVDGMNVGVFDPTPVSGSLTNTSPLVLGQQAPSDTGCLKGSLDEVELFNRVLSNGEIQQIFQAESGGKCKPSYRIIDDMEAYDNACNRIYYTWLDGYGHMDDPSCGITFYPGNNTGSKVGNLTSPYAEQILVHGDTQSMPMVYDNSINPFYSETSREWPMQQTWPRAGLDTLTLWFRGDPFNAPDTIYLVVQDSTGQSTVVSHSDQTIITTGNWEQWDVPLSWFTGVNLNEIKKMVIGFGSRTSPTVGSRGKLYIDDIQLRRSTNP
jgi:hypothetical protein